MNKKLISTTAAPKPVGPYSQAIKVGSQIFLSGQIGINPDTSELVTGGIEAQTTQIMNNIEAILSVHKLNLIHVVKVVLFLTNIKDFKKINDVYQKYFHKPFPARSAVAVKELPLKAEILIDVIAVE